MRYALRAEKDSERYDVPMLALRAMPLTGYSRLLKIVAELGRLGIGFFED